MYEIVTLFPDGKIDQSTRVWDYDRAQKIALRFADEYKTVTIQKIR